MAIAPDRLTLASSDAAGVVKLWDLTHFEVRHSFTAHQGAAWTLAFHPGGKALVSGGQDGRVKFWDFNNGTELGNRRGDSSPVLAAAFSSHGRQLAIGCQDGHVKLWQVGSRSHWFNLCRLEKPVYALTYSPERILLAAGPDKNVTLWHTRTTEKTAPHQTSPRGNSPDVAHRGRVRHEPVGVAAQKLQEFMSTLTKDLSANREKSFRDLEPVGDFE